MILNINKYATVSFSLKETHYLLTTNCINNLYLSHINIINDLEVNFDSKLSFKNHVDLNIYLKIKMLSHTCSLGYIWIIDIVLVVFIVLIVINIYSFKYYIGTIVH